MDDIFDAKDLIKTLKNHNIHIRGKNGLVYSLTDIVTMQHVLIESYKALLKQKQIEINDQEFKEVIDSVNLINEFYK